MKHRFAALLAITLGAFVSGSRADPEASVLRDDETLVLFPAFAARDGQAWRFELRGWVYEPEQDDPLRAAAIGSVAAALGIESEEAAGEVFRRRALLFLADNERGKAVGLELAGRRWVSPETGANGHFRLEARLPSEGLEPGWQPVEADPTEDGRVMRGRLHLIPAEGLSVISDIDDTIKVTQVTDKQAMIRNTFLREFVAAPGMARLYRHWAESRGAVFHFVSSSPWQLYPELEAFRRAERFPPATYSLKSVRFKDSTFFDLFAAGSETKPGQIRPILAAYPGRRFFLVGDSGEHDPEVYGPLARERPEQIEHVFIRDVTPEPRREQRMEQIRAAFAGLPEDRWTVFRDPVTLLGAD